MYNKHPKYRYIISNKHPKYRYIMNWTNKTYLLLMICWFRVKMQ